MTRCEKQIQFTKIPRNGNHSVACKPPLDSSGAGSFWKVTINTPNRGGLYIGIIGNLDASDNSYTDSTFYGWEYSDVFSGGIIKNESSGWTGFTQGECLHFHLISNKLTMFSVQKNRKFIIDDIGTTHAYYIHFNMFWSGDKLTLEPLNEEECAKFL